MNFLAHSFLSFSDEQIVGQFLEDYVRNNERHLLPAEIQKGIKMHREIDTFTDSHPAILEAKKVYAPLVRLYSGAFVDVSMDYFLANDTNIKSPQQWKEHSVHVYSVLKKYIDLFPEPFHRMLAKMSEDDWLYNYREDWGIKFSLQNVLNKAKYLEKDIPVFQQFLDNKSILHQHYTNFINDLIAHMKRFDELN